MAEIKVENRKSLKIILNERRDGIFFYFLSVLLVLLSLEFYINILTILSIGLYLTITVFAFYNTVFLILYVFYHLKIIWIRMRENHQSLDDSFAILLGISLGIGVFALLFQIPLLFM